MSEAIIIRGARQHNLQDVTVHIPKNKLTVISGVSGSGKSSLAFNTLYAEGQRAYVESLSTYARQFLDRLEKPDVDSIEGIQPAIAIRQRNSIRSSRSTVGTATEIYDYLRLLFARLGSVHCLDCGESVKPDHPDGAARAALERWADGTKTAICFPQAPTETMDFEELRQRLLAQGYVRAWVDGGFVPLGATWPKSPGSGESVWIVADRVALKQDARSRLAEAIEAALHAGAGRAAVFAVEVSNESLLLDQRYLCPKCERSYEEPTPQLFSFNNPQGACPACNGFGEKLEFDERRIIPDLDRSLGAGAVRPWASESFVGEFQMMLRFCELNSIPIDVSYRRLPERMQKSILEGDGKEFAGVLHWLEQMREHPEKEGHRFFTRRYMGRSRCRSCRGTRLRAEARAVRFAGREIGEICAWPIPRALQFVEELRLEGSQRDTAGDLVRELIDRLSFLQRIGLGYLSLERASRTLSGGEMQRIHLSNSLGSRLVETLYVLDEPSIGLHPRDTQRLLVSLRALADQGNTVVVVEHDPEILRSADRLIDLGPGAGIRGGRVLHEGPPPVDGGSYDPESLTCRYLAGELEVGMKLERRAPGRRRLSLVGARRNNLCDVDFIVPLGLLVCVSGVSGSGKSSFVNDLLFPALEGQISPGRGRGYDYDALHGSENVQQVVLVDQSPVGRSARSNPATYLQVFGDIRDLFAQTQAARQRGWTAGRFSFNLAGGRCKNCHGMGEVTVEMHFMADVTVPCEECHGKRFEERTLEIRYRGLNIAEVLDLTVDEAIAFFSDQTAIGSRLWLLQRVGLGYLRLGQAASTLSGGESQRIKIARELMGSRKGHTLYLLDEPTTGLHSEDVKRLLKVLDDLVDGGDTVLVIEHNLDVLKNADYILDLGPGGGPDGGRLVVAGPPESLVENGESITGQFLAPLLKRRKEEA
jgi:excinuclease ABC subunit A